jgi:hypothetical protein
VPNQTQEIALARSEAQRFSRLNRGGGVSLDLGANTSNDLEGELVVGRLDNPSNSASTLRTDVTPYDSVRVRVQRSAARNGAVRLFFGPIFDRTSTELSATATATYEGGILGFRFTSPGSQTNKLLPFALDINTWNSMISGNGPDQWTYDPATRAYGPGSDGIKETKLYPVSNGGGNGNGNSGNGGTQLPPGNFGTVDIGSASNSTNDIKRQILNGPNQADFNHHGGQLTLSAAGTLILEGDTGISAGFKAELEAIRGQPRIIPLYQSPVVGNGNNAKYTIVGFAGIVILDVVLTGSQADKHVTIQPEFVIDETAVGGGTSTTSRFVYKPLQLTR